MDMDDVDMAVDDVNLLFRIPDTVFGKLILSYFKKRRSVEVNEYMSNGTGKEDRLASRLALMHYKEGGIQVGQKGRDFNNFKDAVDFLMNISKLPEEVQHGFELTKIVDVDPDDPDPDAGPITLKFEPSNVVKTIEFNGLTLEKAVELVHWINETLPTLTTIVLEKGVHQIVSNYLEIRSAMNIVGRPGVPLAEIVINGGIKFEEGIQGCHLQHLTLRHAKMSGVRGYSSFTMDDVVVEHCAYNGVVAKGTGVVGICTNVEVCQCGGSGVYALLGGSITLIGAKTTVHHNCTDEDSDYGLFVWGSSSTIQVVSPLTMEVSVNNSGGRNYGAEIFDHDHGVWINADYSKYISVISIQPIQQSNGIKLRF